MIIDVRRPGEVETTVVSCTSGYRSSVAASVRRSRGFTDVSDRLGGYDARAAARSHQEFPA